MKACAHGTCTSLSHSLSLSLSLSLSGVLNEEEVDFYESEDSGGYSPWHFISIFLVLAVIAVIAYLCVHNKKKVWGHEEFLLLLLLLLLLFLLLLLLLLLFFLLLFLFFPSSSSSLYFCCVLTAPTEAVFRQRQIHAIILL